MDEVKFNKLMPVWVQLDAKMKERDAILASDTRNIDNIELWVNNRRLPWTIESVLQAVDALHEQGLLVWFRSPAPPPPPPVVKPKTTDELAAEENARQHRDYMDSIKPQPSWEDRVKAEKAKRLAAEVAKSQHDAETSLALLIGTGKPGEPLGSLVFNRKNGFGQGILLSATIQAELRTVVSKVGGKRDSIHTLAAVRSIIAELSDYPQSGDVGRVLASINKRREQSKLLSTPKDSFGDVVKKVGKLGGLR